jgi:hypothetical protein
MVKEYEPFILSYIATMFFGVQFESIDKRRLKVIEIGGTSAGTNSGSNTSTPHNPAPYGDDDPGEGD